MEERRMGAQVVLRVATVLSWGLLRGNQSELQDNYRDGCG